MGLVLVELNERNPSIDIDERGRQRKTRHSGSTADPAALLQAPLCSEVPLGRDFALPQVCKSAIEFLTETLTALSRLSLHWRVESYTAPMAPGQWPYTGFTSGRTSFGSRLGCAVTRSTTSCFICRATPRSATRSPHSESATRRITAYSCSSVAQGAAATIAAGLRRDRVGDRTGSGALRMAGRFAIATPTMTMPDSTGVLH